MLLGTSDLTKQHWGISKAYGLGSGWGGIGGLAEGAVNITPALCVHTPMTLAESCAIQSD